MILFPFIFSKHFPVQFVSFGSWRDMPGGVVELGKQGNKKKRGKKERGRKRRKRR
jgi:hypothetical protein